MADGVVSGLLGSEGGAVLDGFGQESNILDRRGELTLGLGEETLGVDDGLLTLDLGSGVGVSVGSGRGDFSFADDNVLVMLSIGVGLLLLGLGDELIDKSNNIINNTFGSEVNL